LRPAYRFRQFVWALTARVTAGETALLEEYLSPAQRKLFMALDPRDQRHGLSVFRFLVERGYTEKTLLQAALLHDVGKARAGLGIWHRVVIVLLKALWPALWRKIGSADERSWRYPFWAQQHHGELGAEMIATAGGEPGLVELVRGHQTPGDDPLAIALHEADEAN
jgi:HD domain